MEQLPYFTIVPGEVAQYVALEAASVKITTGCAYLS